VLPPIDLFAERIGPVRWVLAPMAGITDMVYRTLARRYGSHVVVSELVSSEGLVRGGQKTRDLMEFGDAERPVGIQIFGHDVATMVEAARIVQGAGADFVDINFGCPVKKVVCDGGGSAWLRDPAAMGQLLTAMKSVLRIPLTIKVRTGWDETSINVKEVVHVAAECGIAWVAIHGRTRAQGYAGVADWELIRRVAIESKIPILGNGDLVTASAARKKLEEGYCHAVMIGRGALKNPWIFRELAGETVEYDFPKLIEEHFELAIERRGTKRAFLSLKKFLAWYASGYPHASTFRASLFKTNDVDELRTLAMEFFRRIQYQPVDDGQPFLMGGHG